MLAALMLSVMGGLWVVSGSSPLAAQTSPSATRSLDSSAVEPGAIVTVTITLAEDYEGNLARITERLPDGFDYVPDSVVGASFRPDDSVVDNGTLVFNLFSLGGLGGESFSYQVTASPTDGSYMFEGDLIDAAQVEHSIEATPITVSTDTGPAPVEIGDLQFDVVPAKAVKGAVVSGLTRPIGTNPLEWEVDTGGAAVTIAGGGAVGEDFRVAETSEGSGKFQLLVEKSGAPALSGTQAISVDVTYEVDGADVTEILTGNITARYALVVTPPGPFTIPQSIGADTPIGAFDVSGGISGEYLDGILTGAGSDLFNVRDADMTLVYRGGDLEVKTYSLSLTVSGDAGLANRTDKVDVQVTVTASNMAPSAPATFTETIEENETGEGLVMADTEVGDASAGVEANDGDSLTYTLVGADDVFDIDEATGMITVGSDGISDSDAVSYSFQIMVSDGISANNQYIDATVDIDVNDRTELVADADLPAGVTATAEGYKIAVSVTHGDVPMTLFNLGDLVSDADGDDLRFSVSGNPSHLVYDSETDNVDLTYLPPGSELGRVNTITVGVSDGFNDADTDDQTLYIEISVTEQQPDPITSSFVGITVAENSTDCSQDDVASGCSLAGVVSGATSFSIESGVDGGNTDYAVADDGTITVLNAPNYEDGLDPAFLVNANGADGLAGLISVRVSVTDVNEDPALAAIAGVPWVYETAQIGDAVVEKPADQDGPAATDQPINISANDPEGATLTYTISEGKPPFAVDASTGALTVSGALNKEAAGSHTFTVKAADPAGNSDEMEITVHVLNANETPQFTSPTGDGAVTTIPENTGNAHVIFTFKATDEDQDDIAFTLREGQSRDLFVIEDTKSEMVDGEEVWSGELHVKSGVTLDYEDAGYDPRVHVEANDPQGLNATLLLTVNLSNVNDNDPAFDATPAASLSVPENTARGFVLANYSASDADGDSVSYSLGGTNAKSFSISATGDLMTLESLDADRQVPCGASGCAVTVIASDGERSATADVRISVTALEDSVSTLDVSKANPVPGTESGHPSTALAGTKTTASSAVPERPSDMPNTGAAYGVTAPVNFVEADWANWGTILRIEVTAESPAIGCGSGNGNQCVVIDVNSDSADTSIKLAAYRSATQENKFVAALMLVELSENATDSDSAEYAHSDGSVARLKVDEEDEIEIKFGNLRGSIDVENEDPEISNFAPEHEAAFDDADVDYTFTVTDSNSGLPEPEDLPDNDGDADYTPVVALISGGQCETHAGSAADCQDSTMARRSLTWLLVEDINEVMTSRCTARGRRRTVSTTRVARLRLRPDKGRQGL